MLRDQGWPGHVIATHLGIGTSTVLRYLHTATLPERTRRSGPVAGQITRVKMLKYQMFGRASLALFGQRFVLIPGRMQEPVQRPLEPSEAQARPSAA